MAFNQLKVNPFQSSGFNCQPAPLHRGRGPVLGKAVQVEHISLTPCVETVCVSTPRKYIPFKPLVSNRLNLHIPFKTLVSNRPNLHIPTTRRCRRQTRPSSSRSGSQGREAGLRYQLRLVTTKVNHNTIVYQYQACTHCLFIGRHGLTTIL